MRILSSILLSFTTSMVLAQQQPNSTLVKNYVGLPLSFEKNRGQTNKRVKFLSRGNGYSLFLTPKEAVFSLKAKQQKLGAVLRMQLAGANPTAKETTESKLSGTTSYFIGNDRSKWRTGVENFGRVGFSEVYKGVDVVYYGNQSQLEYDFIVKPQAEASSIRLKFAGAKSVKALPSGELLLETGNGSLKWHSPVAYQEANGKRRQVSAKYQITKKHEVCFAVGDYDRSRPLVIDPVLAYSTYLGGAGGNLALAIVLDTKGNAYVAGETDSSSFPTTTGVFQTASKGLGDAFLSKISADGKSLLASTYFGGTKVDVAQAVSIDGSGNAYVAGWTESEDIPTTVGAYQKAFAGKRCAFITKISADGKSLLYSTYLGGAGYNYAEALCVDSNGVACVAGRSYYSFGSFPVTTGAFQTVAKGDVDGFVTKLSADGKSLLYSTYFGGKGGDLILALAMDSSGNAYVGGDTTSFDFPTTAGAFQTKRTKSQDAFVTKLSADGKSLLYSTLLGGTSDDSVFAIAVDAGGNAYVTGYTKSTDFPTTAGAFQRTYQGTRDVFISKLNATGSSLLYSTYLGGTKDNYVRDIAVDTNGNAYVAGYTTSKDFPVTSGVVQDKYKKSSTISEGDAFVTKLSADGKVLFYSTYLGGGGKSYDIAQSVAVDSTGTAYVVGGTEDPGFPITSDSFQPTLVGADNAFVTKLNLPHSTFVMPHSILGGEATTAIVLLDHVATADTKVSLASDNSLVTIPSSVVVKKGTNSAKIKVSTSATTVDTEVHLTTTPTEKEPYSVLWVFAPRTLTKLTTPSRVVLNSTATASVTLDAVAPETGLLVNLTSDNPILTVPSQVKLHGSISGSFRFTTGAVTKDTGVSITAEYRGVKFTKKLTILAYRVDTLTLSTATVKGGTSLMGTVTLSGAVPASGTKVTLSSNSTSATVPSTVTIPAGKTSVDFTILTKAVTQDTVVKITASVANGSVSQNLTLTK